VQLGRYWHIPTWVVGVTVVEVSAADAEIISNLPLEPMTASSYPFIPSPLLKPLFINNLDL